MGDGTDQLQAYCDRSYQDDQVSDLPARKPGGRRILRGLWSGAAYRGRACERIRRRKRRGRRVNRRRSLLLRGHGAALGGGNARGQTRICCDASGGGFSARRVHRQRAECADGGFALACALSSSATNSSPANRRAERPAGGPPIWCRVGRGVSLDGRQAGGGPI